MGELRHLRRHRGIRDVVPLGLDDLRLQLAEALFQPLDVVLAVVVVLGQDRDLGRLDVRLDPQAVQRPFADVVRDEPDRPWVLLVLAAPEDRARRQQGMRDVPLVQVRPDCQVRRRPERVENRKDVVLLDEAPCLRHRLGGVVPVVVVLPLDLASVNALVSVVPVEERSLSLWNRPVGGSLAALRERPAEQDRVLRDTGIRRGPGRPGSRRDEADQYRSDDDVHTSPHLLASSRGNDLTRSTN